MKINISDRDKKILEQLYDEDTPDSKRVAKVFQALLLDFNFKKVVNLCWDKVGSPEDRKKEKHVYPFVAGYLNSSNIYDFFPELHDPHIFLIVVLYMLFGDLSANYNPNIFETTGFIKTRSELEKEIEAWDIDEDTIIIEINPYSTKEEIINFIEEEYSNRIKKIKEEILDKDQVKSRVNLSKKFVRNVAIFNKNEELKNIPKEKRSFRTIEGKIKKDLDLEISINTIKSITSKIRQKIEKVNKDTKDFEEIDFHSYIEEATTNKDLEIPGLTY